VDAGDRVTAGGVWLWATHLRYGDELRTADGRHASVVRVRLGVGNAEVWTLTVATGHTFFVGAAQVLVHNAQGCGPLSQDWNRRVQFQGNRVYQRDNLIDPNLTDSQGRTNLQRMQGLRDLGGGWIRRPIAPIGPDGESLQIHHMLQTQDGPLAEVTGSFHRNFFGILHINVGSGMPSGIDRSAFNSWKLSYWANRANDFLP